MDILQGSGSPGQNRASNIFDAIRNAGQGGRNSERPDNANADSATHISLSAEARARLESDQQVADELAQAASQQAKPAEDRSKDISLDELFDKASASQQGNKNSELKIAGTPEELKASLKEASMRFWVGLVERKNPEGAQGLRDALANGTARVRMADDVPGVNTKTTVSYSDGGMKTSTVSNPSPAIKADLDAGRSLVVWNAGAGDIYITW